MKSLLIFVLSIALCAPVGAQRISERIKKQTTTTAPNKPQVIRFVSGRVTHDDKPLQGCVVCEVDATGRVYNSVKTDVNGIYEMPVRDNKQHMLTFEAEGFRTVELRVNKKQVNVAMEPKVVRQTAPSMRRAVDLGLSVKWADCNVGANAPYEAGMYVSWGELEEKRTYLYSCTENYEYGLNGSKYDLAEVMWKEDWHMPTYTEVSELVTRCVWAWTEKNGVKGFVVTGPSGKSIFLPACGYRDGTELIGEGVTGCYWTETPYVAVKDCSYALQISEMQIYRGHRTRSFGYLVRPVWK